VPLNARSAGLSSHRVIQFSTSVVRDPHEDRVFRLNGSEGFKGNGVCEEIESPENFSDLLFDAIKNVMSVRCSLAMLRSGRPQQAGSKLFDCQENLLAVSAPRQRGDR
jgi:hypothetical protein